MNQTQRLTHHERIKIKAFPSSLLHPKENPRAHVSSSEKSSNILYTLKPSCEAVGSDVLRTSTQPQLRPALETKGKNKGGEKKSKKKRTSIWVHCTSDEEPNCCLVILPSGGLLSPTIQVLQDPSRPTTSNRIIIEISSSPPLSSDNQPALAIATGRE